MGGAGRSGSTLLRNMLDAHPLVAVPNESYFVLSAYSALAASGRSGEVNLAWEMIRRHRYFIEWGLGEQPVLSLAEQHPPASYPDLIRVIFAAYAASHGKPFSADKTPVNALTFTLLSQMFPTSRFLHIVRDPRAVAMSAAVQHWNRRGITAAANQWAETVKFVHRAQAHIGGRILEVRYERLVSDPRGELRRVCSFSGIPYDPVMLEYSRSARISAGTHHARSVLPPRPDLRRWEEALTSRDVSIIEYRCGPAMERLGYRRAGKRAGPRARACVLGDRLVSRLEWLASVRCGVENNGPKALVPSGTPAIPWLGHSVTSALPANRVSGLAEG